MPIPSFKLPQQKIFLLLVIANIAVYVWQVFSGVDWNNPALADLVKWGANVAPLTMQGESWRLFTSMFLHIGFLHIALNMYMLFLCGRIVERAFGSINFTLIYVISGLFGSLASALWYAHHQVQTLDIYSPFPVMTAHLQLLVSAGASGALMGITGAFLAHWLVNWVVHRDKADAVTLKLYGAFAQVVVINLVMGFTTQGVDNACHLGGVVSGAIVGGLLAITPSNAATSKRFAISFAISLVSLSLLYLGTHLTVSDELKQLKTQLFTEMQELEKEKNLAAEKVRIAAEIVADAKLAPKPVDAKTAAGEQIDLSQHLSKNTFISDMQLSADGNTLVILAGELDNKLLMVDLKTKKIRGEIKGPLLTFESENCQSLMCEGKGADTVVLSPDGRLAYVSSMVQNAVSVVDLKQQKILSNIPTGAFPRAMAIAKNGKRAYVANGVDNSVSVLDLINNKAVGSPIAMEGGTAENLPFGHADGIWLVNDDTQLWVLNAVLNQIQVIDTATLKTIKSIDLAESNFRDAKVGADGHLWIIGNNGIEGLNLTSAAFDKNIPFSSSVSFYDIATSANKNVVAIAEDDGGYSQMYVHVIKTNTGKTIGRYPIFGPSHPVFSNDGKQIYVMSHRSSGYDKPEDIKLIILNVDKTLEVNTQEENLPS
jgi:rhomboid protease GluP